MEFSDIINVLDKVEHPAIKYSLIKLGIVTDIELKNNKVSLVFAFPFPNIPIADTLILIVAQPLQQLGLEFEYHIRIMNNDERNRFLQLEAEAWRGLKCETC